MGDLNHQPSIDLTSYSQDVPAANANDELNGLCIPTYQPSSVSSGPYYVSLDLENCSKADKGAIFSGWNSNTDDIYFIPSFDAAEAFTARFDSSASFDTVLCFENNTCYAKYLAL